MRSIVTFLGGDPIGFERLWRDAYEAQARVRTLSPIRGGGPAGPTVAAATPWQLPPDVFGFTGRVEALRCLDKLAAEHDPTTALPIALVGGRAGIGKSAVAIHWAHQAAVRFPDGCLYIDMRGEEDDPVPPEHALARFLRSLGGSCEAIPPDLAERAAAYRSLLAGRRILVVLDNVVDVEQVRPLLPGGPPGFVLVTSRRSLADLVTRDGARRIDLSALDSDESATLLRTLIGMPDPSILQTLAEMAGGQPGPLRAAAELATRYPGFCPHGIGADGIGRRTNDLDGNAVDVIDRPTESWTSDEGSHDMVGRRRVLVIAALLSVLPYASACAQGEPADGTVGSVEPDRQLDTEAPGASAAAAAGSTVDTVGARYADWYAGVRVDGDRLLVYRKPGSDLDSAVRTAVTDVPLTFQDAPHSRAELTRFAAKLQADTTYWQSRGIPIWSVSVRFDGTGVEVGTPAGDALLAAAPERYDAAPIVILAMSDPPRTVTS